MQNPASDVAAAGDGFLDRGDNEAGSLAVVDGPANDPVREQVFDRAEVELRSRVQCSVIDGQSWFGAVAMKLRCTSSSWDCVPGLEPVPDVGLPNTDHQQLLRQIRQTTRSDTAWPSVSSGTRDGHRLTRWDAERQARGHALMLRSHAGNAMGDRVYTVRFRSSSFQDPS